MNMFVKVALAGLISLVVVIGGCQKDRPEPARDPLDEKYKLIDQGNYNQAISELQTLSTKDARPAVMVALASAFAARGGIRVEKYWGFVIGFDAKLVPSDALPTNATIESLQRIAKQAKGDIDPRDLKALGNIVNAMAVWERYKDRIDAIPVVSGPQMADVIRATQVLAGVQTPGGRLYRAILNLILFKSYITASQGLWDQFNKAVEDLMAGKIEVLCQFNFNQILNWLGPLTQTLVETLNDLVIAFPEDRKDLEGARDIVQGVYELVQEAVADLKQKRTCDP